ncbi:MAG TPA: RNB domain-containing ribonuclease [Solirubrobacterales bacterium]|nr:RNB domain-containing ribonuclease [Solirubrobacterales bacterium]
MPGRGRGRRDRARAEAPRRRSRRGGVARSERRAREREAQRPARETVEELLREELGFRGFRPTIEGEAREAAKWAERESGPRRDLTALATFTVDPATARDFDDAVSAQHEGDGARVWVHIADVAAHVKPGSLLDQEARRRGNSTYVPGAVEPMLPHALSSEACSLAPGVERLAVTTEIELDAGMNPQRARFYRSRIRSDARLNYDQLDEIFAGRRRPPAEVAEPLAAARAVAAGLGEHRGTTSLDVESFEPEFEFDVEGNVVRAHGVAQTEAHRLIERLMILNNEQVAELLERERVPAIYRVHAQPDAARIEHLLEQLAALEVPTPPLRGGLAPREAGRVAAEASRLARQEARRRGHGREAYTSLVLRSLKQAYYSERNLGHAGLGSSAYCHFTSPIRRYPDLVCHRALLAHLGEGEEAPTLAQARDAAADCSARERTSAQIERHADDVCAAYLLERELGERGLDAVFEGEISGVIRSAAFVAFRGKLGDVYEGMLPARRLPGEYFQLDQAEVALVGRESGARVRLGDPISVRVAGIDPPRGRAELDLAGEPSEEPS